jgi:hypothetical protein
MDAIVPFLRVPSRSLATYLRILPTHSMLYVSEGGREDGLPYVGVVDA